MPRPRKHPGLYGRQDAYHQTEKGKEAQRKSQTSKATKEKKRDWWRNNRGKRPIDRKQHFIDKYGDIETALKLLDKREKFVVIHLNGLDGSEPMTQEAVGQELFLTGSRIGQIYKDALKKLVPIKKAISEDADPEK